MFQTVINGGNKMSIFKRILIGLGVLTLVLIILAGIAMFFISKESKEFEKEYSPLASQFLYQLSSTWELADVQDSLTNDWYRSKGCTW